MPRNVNLYQDLCIFTGNAHPRLAASICEYLKMPLGELEVFEFSNENIFVRVLENVRSKDVFIVQPLSTPVSRSVMELLIMIDAFRRASAGRITAVMPFYGYGRSDKKDQPRVPITARLLANLIETAAADRVLTLDLHAGQIQGFFNIPVDELTALPLLASYFRRRDLSRTTVLASDVGGAKRARTIARMLGTPLAVVDKERVDNAERVEANALIGDVEGLDVIIPDDEILTGGTIIAAAQIAFERGARSVTASCVHPILSGNAVEKICGTPVHNGDQIRELVVTDTIPLGDKAHDKITVLSVAPLLGDAITRIHTGQSIGELLTALEAGGSESVPTPA
jgi:ribose-phosphate pyrophosphokinase